MPDHTGNTRQRLDVRIEMRALWLLLLVACRPGGAGPGAGAATETATGTPAVPAPGPRTGPPRGSISLIAVTDQGDAALTADTERGLRLWPSLDGTRPPVIVPPLAASQLALARTRGGFVAGVLDEAGHLRVIRMAGDGTVVGSVQLASGAGYDDVVAVRDGLLVLGRDQIVARLDAGGREVARLAPRPHERVVGLAARRGEAIAGIGDHGAATSVRWLALDNGLAWGAAVELAAPLGQLALSPDHRRIAGVVADQGEGRVIELAPVPRVVAAELYIDSPSSTRHEPSTIGFVDDVHVAMVGGFVLRWAGTPYSQAVGFSAGVNSAQAVFGDGVVVVGRGDALAPVRWHEPVRYLGYHELGVGAIMPAGRDVAMGLGSGTMWFDSRLGVTRVMEDGDQDSHAFTRPLDDHLVVTELSPAVSMTRKGDGLLVPSARAPREPTRFVVRDLQRSTARQLGAWHDVQASSFDPASRVLAVASGRQLRRFAIDDRGAATELAVLALQVDPQTVAPIDPRRAGGIAAIAVAHDGEQLSIETLHEAGTAVIQVTATRLLGIDHGGTVWLLRGEHEILAYRDGARVRQLAVATPVDEGAVSSDGSFVVLYRWQASELFVLDASGRERWRRPLGPISTVELTGDDRGVVVGTDGAVIWLDAATGGVLASGCAWDFGLHDQPSLSNATQCNEPE
jgi:hypothetical protein